MTAVVALGWASPSVGAPVPRRLFAVIVGSNDPGDTGLLPLHYADDDAARNDQLLRLLGAETELLTSPDTTTRERFRARSERPDGGVPSFGGDIVVDLSRAQKPTRENLLQALERTFARIRKANDEGAETELFFWYTGHGTLKDASGVLVLEKSVFSRSDLYDQLITVSPAGFNHVFIDACGAAAFVSSRGGATDEERRRRQDDLIASYVDRESLSRFPKVGVLFAATRDGSVHEWSHFEGGVFSFELRSALLNAADIDGDQRVSYLEAFAFLTAANQSVTGGAAHMDIVRRVPVDELHRTIADWSAVAKPRTLLLGAGNPRHVWVADERGVPVVETNKDTADDATLVMPEPSDRDLHLVGGARGEQVWSLPATGDPVKLDELERTTKPNEEVARGDVSVELRRGLFRVAYGRAYYNGVSGTLERGAPIMTMPVAPSYARRYVAYGLGAAAVAAGVAAWAFRAQSNEAYQHYLDAPDAERSRWQSSTRRWDWATTGTLIGAGVAALAGTTLLLIDLRTDRESTEVALGVTSRF